MTKEEANISCPQCQSVRIIKYGFDSKGRQLFLCRNCLRRFHVKRNIISQGVKLSDSVNELPYGIISLARQHSPNQLSFIRSEYVGSHELPSVGKSLNKFTSYSRELEAAEMQLQRQTETPQNRMPKEIFKGKLVEFAFYLKKKGRADKTIKTQCGCLKTLSNLAADLLNPDHVKSIVALKEEWSQGTKKNIINSYRNFATCFDIQLPEMPQYKPQQKLPFIPTESELDQLIACAGPKLQPFLQTLKESGARTGEAAALKWENVDLERHTITINTPEKGSNPRQVGISEKLVEMLKSPDTNGDLAFGENATKRMRKNFHWTRQRLACRTKNPRIKQIHLHTFRHWHGSTLYHYTKDIMLVKERLGHKSITSTQIYVQLLQGKGKEEYISKTATTLEEAQTLIESGFEYVTDMQFGEMTYKLFRKRKPWQPS